MAAFSLFDRNRNRLVVKGVGPIVSNAQRSQEVWKSHLVPVLRLIGPGVKFDIKSVIMYSPSNPVYDVELDSNKSVDAIFNASYRFVRRNDPIQKPTEIERISIFRSVTPATRVRISLLRVRELWPYYFFKF